MIGSGDFDRTDVRAVAEEGVRNAEIVHRSCEAALIGGDAERLKRVRRSLINGGAAGQGKVRVCWSAVVREGAKHRIGVSLVASGAEESSWGRAAIASNGIAAEIEAVRGDDAGIVKDAV